MFNCLKCRIKVVRLVKYNFTFNSSSKYVPKCLFICRFFQSVSKNDNPLVSISNIKTNLLKCGLEFDDGFTNIKTECASCKKQSLYINKVTGFCLCNNCFKCGPWKQNFSDKEFSLEINEDIRNGTITWKNISSNLSQTGFSINDIKRKILQLCQFDYFPESLLNKLEVGFDENNLELFIPLKNENRVVGYKRFSSAVETTFPPIKACGVIQNLVGADAAVVVQSVKDLVALSHYKLPYDLICLPHGQTSLPQEILPIFEKYKKIVLWFDNDLTSWDNVRVFAKKLDEDRCFLVRPLEDQPCPHKAHKSGFQIVSILKSAQPIHHSSIITFKNLREDVLSDLQNIDKVSGVKWTRFPKLNDYLKGHRRGELTVFTGSTGCGKTTFMSEYSLDLAMQGVATLWGSFEIRNQRLARTMLQQFVLKPLESNMKEFDIWADRFQNLPIYFLTFHGQQSLDIVMEAVSHATYVHDIAHVIIDNVQFMLGLTDSNSSSLDRFYKQDALIAAFRNFATKANCHVTLVIHPRKEREGEQLNVHSIFGGAKATQEADNVMILQTKTLINSLKLKKYIQIVKNRYTGDIGLMPLEFDKELLSFSVKN